MSKHFSEIKGAGGGGGGGNSSPPYEAPDSLSSTSEARMLYALSEGRIGGLVEGARSVFLDGTRVQNVDGTNNFSRVIVETRAGTPDQSPISGFDSVQSETSVGVEVRRAAPVVRTVNDPNADRLRVTVGHQGLLQQTDNGDRVNANVRYTIEVRPNGGVYQTVVDHDEYGKTKARFQRSHTFSLPPGGNPWDVRITRLTDDSTTDKVVNPLAWDTYATIIDAKISYKNTALLALGLDAREFSSLPRVEVELYGKDDIRIPSNYDPLTRTYSGAWDGTFKTGYTNNPVWIFNDLVLAKRYGLGQRIPAELMNKWALYRIAKYCDEYVPDGFGGLEPRFTCNIDLRGAAEDAYKVLNRLVSVFRAMLYWAGGVINAVQDAPVDVVSGVFSHANVVDGKFSYAGSPRRERHTVVIVKYRNPDDNYRYAFEPVEHPEMLAKYGPRILEVEAVGCTSRGQAARFGRWILWTEWNETDVVTFTAGFDASMLAPGAVIMVSDAVRQGGRHGGRLQAGSTASVLQLDSQVEVTASGFTVACVLPDGSVQSRGVLNAPGQASQLMLDTPLSAEPVLNAMWAVKYKLFRVVKVTESDQHLFEVSAVEHSPGKYAEVEGGVYFDPDDVALTPSPVEVVTVSGLQLSKYAVIERGGYVRSMLSASWDRPDTPYALRYAVQWQQPDGSWSDPEIVLGLSAETEAAKQGQYKIRVSTANNLGRWSPYIESNAIAVDGSEVAPDVPGPTSLALVSAWTGLEFIASWQRVGIANGYRVRVELPNGFLVQEAWVAKALEYKFSYDLAKAAGKVSRTYVVKVRAELDNGAASDWVSISVANPVPAVLAGVQAQPGYKAIDVKLEPDTSADVAGYRIWVSTAPNTVVDAATLAYDGANPQAYLTTGPGGLPLEAGVTYYVRAAAYDVWGSEVNPTSAAAVVPVSVAGGIRPGEITDAMVAGLNAGKIQGQLVDSQVGNVSAGKLLGQLQDVQIAEVSASKVAGRLADSQIGAVSAAKVAGQLTSSQLAGIEAGKLIGQVAMTQLASDVQGSLNSAITTANQALVKANEAATATSVSQLQARVDALNSNLLPVDLWKPNGQPLPAPWRNNTNTASEQALVSLPGPYGDSTTVLKAVASGGDNDGGWDVDIKIDPSKAYRFSVWIKDVSGASGTAYLGIQGVQQNGVDVPNPYFLILPKSAMADGVWHLFVGYVYPTGSALPANAQTAVYDGATGNVVHLGNDFNWAPYAEWVTPRCYQYYANEGAEQWFAHPRFEVVDGREPSIAQLLSGAGLSVARGAITRVANVEAALPGKANVTDVTQLQARVGQAETNVQSALTRVGAVEAELPGKASAADVTSLSAKVNVRRTYNLRASGNGYDGRYGLNQGLFSIDGAQVAVVSGYNRSYTVVTFNTVGNVTSVKPFDVYGSGEASVNGGAPQMAVYLDSLAAGTLVLVYTSDEPRSHRLTGGLSEAMYRCGASPAVFGSDQFQYRSVYALFGKAGGVAGSGQEFYKGGIDTDPAAFFSLSFEVINGEFVGISPGPGTQVAAALDRVSKVEAELPGKASATDLATLQGRVSAAETNVNSALTRVGAVESALPGKANASDLTQLQAKVSSSATVGKSLNADPGCLDPLAWVHGGHGAKATFVAVDDGVASYGAIKTGSYLGHSVDSAVGAPCDPTKLYRISCWAKKSADSTSVLYLRYVSKAADGSYLAQFSVEAVGGGLPLEAIQLTTEWAKYEAVFRPAASVKLIAPRVIGNWLSDVGYQLIQDIRIEAVDTVADVNGLPSALAEKATQTEMNAANSRLSTVEATLPGKASATDVTNLQGRVTNTELNVSSALSRVGAVEAALPGKASATDVSNLTAELNANKATSGNLIQNSDVELNTDGWWFYTDVPSDYNSGHVGRDTQPQFVPPGRHTLVIRQTSGSSAGMWCCYVPVVAGRSYIASAYTSEHRANMLFALGWEDVNGNRIGMTHSPEYGNTAPLGADFQLWPRRFFSFTAPPGAVRAVVHIVKANTLPGNADSWLFICNPMVEETSATQPSPYTPGDKVFNLATNFKATVDRVANAEASLSGKASASEVTTLVARVGNVEGSVASVSQSVATLGNKVNTSYGVALGATLSDGRRKLSGFQALNDGSVSQFVITADQLLIQPSGMAINLDPNFTDSDNWVISSGHASNAAHDFGFVTSAPGAVANTCLYAQNNSGIGEADLWLYSKEIFPINPEKVYRLSGRFYSDIGNGRAAYLAVMLFDSLGNMLMPGWGGSWSGYPWSGVPSEGAFTEYAGEFGPGTGRVIPSNATQVRVGVVLNYGPGGQDRRMAVQDVRLQEVLPSTLIQNGAITTDKLSANAVTANKIAANAVDASHIQAGTITADKLLVGYGDNLIADPYYRSPAWWGREIQYEFSGDVGWAKSERRMIILPGYQETSMSSPFAVEPGATYRLEVQVYGNNAVGGLKIDLHVPGIYWWSFGGGHDVYLTQGQTGHRTYSNTFTIPNMANTNCNIRIVNHCSSGSYIIGLVSMTRVSGATLIQDGAIITDKLAANAVTADKIAANSVSATHIVGGTITGDKVAANTLTGDKIAVNTINAAHIQALSVTSDKLAAGSVVTGKIAVGVITASELASGSVTSDKLTAASVTGEKIAAGSITADKIQVSTLSALSANIGVATAGRLQNSQNTSYINLEAAGQTPFIQIGSAFTLNADGSGSIDSRLLSQIIVRDFYLTSLGEVGTFIEITHSRGRPVIYTHSSPNHLFDVQTFENNASYLKLYVRSSSGNPKTGTLTIVCI